MRFTFWLIFLYPSFVYANTVDVSGKVVDFNDLPIPYVNVFIYFSGAIEGTVTNTSGEFRLNAKLNDTIRFSCVGFYDVSVIAKDILRNNSIHLTTSKRTLPTVVFMGISARDFLVRAISRIPDNHILNVRSKGYFWNSIIQDSVCVKFQEGFASVSHGVEKKSYNIGYDSILLDYRKDSLKMPLLNRLNDLFEFDFVEKNSGLINTNNIDDWRYEYIYQNSLDYDKIALIKATRRLPFKTTKVDSILIYIDNVDYSFKRIDFSYSWDRNNEYNVDVNRFVEVDQVKGSFIYSHSFDKYSLKYCFVTLSGKIDHHNPRGLSHRIPISATCEFLVSSSYVQENSTVPSFIKNVINRDVYIKNIHLLLKR